MGVAFRGNTDANPSNIPHWKSLWAVALSTTESSVGQSACQLMTTATTLCQAVGHQYDTRTVEVASEILLCVPMSSRVEMRGVAGWVGAKRAT